MLRITVPSLRDRAGAVPVDPVTALRARGLSTSRWRARAVAVAAHALLAACGGARPVGVTVVLEGATAESAEVRHALAEPIDPAVTLRIARVPAARQGASADDEGTALGSRIAAARSAYVETLDFGACIEALSDAELVPDALARGDREGAARALTFLCACH
ncbi:MAG: hypothetical protein M3Y87_13205, partial [Myxococcota bacterium]|nr:hypothetical protein [Myxococcota bacterium]